MWHWLLVSWHWLVLTYIALLGSFVIAAFIVDRNGGRWN